MGKRISQVASTAPTTQPVVSSFTYDKGGDTSKADQHRLVADGTSALSGAAQASAATTQSQRFYGSITLDTTRAVRDATAVIEEVAQHLNGLLGARVEITMEIHAELPEGTPEHVVRTVTENCRTLKFTNYGFERQ